MITERDLEVIGFVNEFGAATTSQLAQVYYPPNKKVPNQRDVIVRRRLKKLVDSKMLKRKRYHLNMEYIYYTKWSNQINHKIVISDTYLKLKAMPGELEIFDREFPLDELRPDAVIKYKYKNQIHWFFLEAQLSNKFNQQKYEDYYTKREYTKIFTHNGVSTFPKVIIVTPKKNLLIRNSRIKYIPVKIDLSDLDKIFD